MTKQTKILIAPLNWGLGHASRCVPLIGALLDLGALVQIASDGQALSLLKKEFPSMTFHELPAYDVHYEGKNMGLNIASQSAKLLRAIRKERRETSKLVRDEAFDFIISDSRFGVFHPKVPSIFITHQLNIIAPNSFLQMPVNFANHFFLKNFDRIWVPDFAGDPNLSGKLSHGSALSKVGFMGPLSRLKKMDLEKKFAAAFILSGPEPARTELEKIILAQASKIPKKFLLVRGLPDTSEDFSAPENVEVISFLPSAGINEFMERATLVVARSGYSTIMDLWATGKRAILIPTPGQTEQEYLAEKFQRQHLFLTANQANFDLEFLLKEVEYYPGIKKSDYLPFDLPGFLKAELGLG